LWEWLSSRFRRPNLVTGAHGSRPGEEERRRTPPASPKVTIDRVSKRRSPSRGPTKEPKSPTRPKSAKWPDKCARFTKLLISIFKRDERLRLYERQKVDAERSRKTLQQCIDATTLRHHGDLERASDGTRTKRYALRRTINGHVSSQRDLEKSMLWLDGQLGTSGAVQAVEEDDLFKYVDWVMEHCGGKNDCVDFTLALRESLRDAAEIRQLVQATERELQLLRTELPGLQEGLRGIPNDIAQAAAAQLRHIARRADELERAMPARQESQSSTLWDLYALLRHTLSAHGLVEPEDGGTIYRPPSVETSDDIPAPLIEQPTQKLLGDHRIHRNFVQKYQQDLDGAKADYKPFKVRCRKKFHGETDSRVDERYFNQIRVITGNLQKAEREYVTLGDRVKNAGGEPLPLVYYRERYDFPEFAGDHPKDGDTDSRTSSIRKAYPQAIAQYVTPNVSRWRDVVDSQA